MQQDEGETEGPSQTNWGVGKAYEVRLGASIVATSVAGNFTCDAGHDLLHAVKEDLRRLGGCSAIAQWHAPGSP